MIAALAAVPDGAATSPTELPVADLVHHPDNVRGTDLGDLTELADSIRGSGVIMPLVVASTQAWRVHHSGLDLPGQWVIIAGHRRHAAAVLAGLDTVPVVVRDDLADPTRTTTAMLVENIHRQNLAPLEEAGGLAALVDAGLSQREISRRTGISQAQVSKRLTLLKLSDSAKAALSGGAMSVETALNLLKLPINQRDTILDSGSRRLVGEALAERVRRALVDMEDQRRHDAVIIDLRAAGVTVVESIQDAPAGSANYFLHRDDDVAAARVAQLAFAHVPPWVRHFNQVSWYCIQAPPWPWQPAPVEEAAPDSDSTGISRPTRQVYDDAAANRRQFLREYLRHARSTDADRLLLQLVLINARDETTWWDEPHDLVALVGVDPDRISDPEDPEPFLEVLESDDRQLQVQYALANQFARLENRLPDPMSGADRQLGWELPADVLSYFALLVELGYQLHPAERDALAAAFAVDHPSGAHGRRAALRAGVTPVEQESEGS